MTLDDDEKNALAAMHTAQKAFNKALHDVYMLGIQIDVEVVTRQSVGGRNSCPFVKTHPSVLLSEHSYEDAPVWAKQG